MKIKIITISLILIALILLFNYAIPDFPYSRRLSKVKANLLVDKFRDLYSKDSFTKNEVALIDEIKLKLIKAGYRLSFNKNKNGVSTNLEYPKYAQ